MKSLMEIRKDLKEIRYYYMRRADIEKSFSLTGVIDLMDMVNLYNHQIRKASFEVYDTYSSLYLENHTQQSLADKWGYSLSNIRIKHNKLLAFLQENITDN